MSGYELLFGDCLEKMKGIPDGSVDMILCDLPQIAKERVVSAYAQPRT